MDIVLGVSMTPTTVRMVLVEGEKADGVTVDHDVFNVASDDGSANVAEQVVAAIQGTKESAETGGHHLKSIGVTWSDHTEASALRDALTAHGIDDVMLVAESHAAASLAQAVGRAIGYDITALLFVDRDTATLSVVRTDDGSVVKVLSRTLHSADAMAVLTEMAAAVAAQDAPPQGLFVVGSGVDVSSVKAHLEHLVALPVNAPDDAELALARGAALASAAAPAFEATTVGLAYSQDPDGATAGSLYAGLAGADTQLAAVEADEVVDEFAPTEMREIEEGRKPFLLVGSALTSVFVIGVVALVLSLAVSIRPTVDSRPSPAQAVIAPSSQAPAPAPIEQAAQVPPPPAPSAETIKPPVPVAVQQTPQQAPRTVYVEQAPAPAPAAPAPAPAAPAPAPAAPAPVVAPPVVVPPPVIVVPRRQWPVWTQPKPAWTWPSKPQAPEPEEPETPPWNPPVTQVPQVPQVPQTPQWPGSGSGSGSGSNSSGRGDSDYGRGSGGFGDSGSSRGSSGSSGGNNCFLIFCAPGGGRG
ncbi:hypothetical protein ASG82_14605 [Mycobacterium sp. Soil538]|nr:hypothetical protein ASG82_14605 [Mycobacterium sp. Soil538]